MNRHSYLAIALLAVGLYAVSLAGTFVYDDVAVVLTDRRIADAHAWGEYWTDSYNFGVDNLYRPLVSMTYAVQHWLHGENAWPYHAVNVVLHAIASVLVAWVAYRLASCVEGGSPCRWGGTGGTAEASRNDALQERVALVSGLLFAAHPVHVEAVANIVGRAELMCGTATLGAVGLALRPLTAWRVVVIWLLSAVAILCKEQGLLAPLMVGIAIWLAPGAPTSESDDGDRAIEERRKQLIAILFVLLLANVVAIVFVRENLIHLKFWWDRKFLDPWIQPLSDSVGADRWLAPITIAGRYFGLLVAPVTLRIDYGGPIVPGVVDVRDPFFWLGIAAIVVWVSALAIAWRRRERPIVAALMLFGIAYAPVSNFATIIGVNVAERVMYLPSAFFVIFVAKLLVRLPRRVVMPLVAVVTLLFSVRTVTYAWQWNDRLRLYEYATRVEPRSMKATLLAMQELIDREDLMSAERYGRHATEIDPTYDPAWLKLAGVLIDEGKLDEATAAVGKAREIRMTAEVGKYDKLLAEKRAATTR